MLVQTPGTTEPNPPADFTVKLNNTPTRQMGTDESGDTGRETGNNEQKRGRTAVSEDGGRSRSAGEGDRGRESEGDERKTGSTDSGGGAFAVESYYDLLGVSGDATGGEIERAYREMAKRHHPDASDRPEEEAERRFRRLLAARDVLTSAEHRRAYDELGHEEFCRQSERLGEPVTGTDTDGPTAPEPRPEPETGPDRSGRVQRSARGEAHRRGDPLVTDTATAVTPTADGSPGDDDDRSLGDDDGRSSGSGGVYRLVTRNGTPASRSLQLVAGRWARSWRTRVAVGLGTPLLAAGVLTVLPSVLDASGVAALTPAATPRLLYAVALAATVGYTACSCARTEARLPRGQFLADRDHGRFTTAAARRYRRRGGLTLCVVLGLVLAAGQTGAEPWPGVTDAVRGDLSEPVWFDTADTGWVTAVDGLLTGLFALGVVSGTLLVALGTSIALWRDRYERGDRLHPGLWEPVLAAALVSVLFGLVTRERVGRLRLLSGLPDEVAAAVAVDGTTVTVSTLAVAGILVTLAGVPLRWLRVRLPPGDRHPSGTESPESE